jgi:LacI family transcriptional regulator
MLLLTDIARLAGVSPSTISRAINQPGLLSTDSLARIQAVMKEHNYTPAPLSRRRGPKSRKPTVKKIGVWFVGGESGNPNLNWFQDHLTKIESFDPRTDVDLNMLFSNSADDLPRAITAEKFDGLIIQGMEPSAAILKQLRRMPSVWFMTRRSANYPGDFVEPNNEENGCVAADYLKAQGHTSVAVLTTDPGYSANVRRVSAFMGRAQALGLPCHQILGKDDPNISFLEIAPLNSEVQLLVQRLTELTPRPTGLYIPVDHFVGAFFRTLRQAGLQPQRDFEAIIGNYNPFIYHNLEHHPAVIDINLSSLVRKVIDQLLWRIENPDAPGRVGIAISPTLRPAQKT